MANIKSKKKRILTNKKSEDINRALKSRVKTEIKKAYDTGKKEDISNAIKWIDKAEKKNIFHKNKAARLKSKLDLFYNKTQSENAIKN